MQSGKSSRNAGIAAAPADGLSRKSSRNSRKSSPAAASRRAWTRRVGTSGRPKAIQIRGSNLVCAIVRRPSEYHTNGRLPLLDLRGAETEKVKTGECGGGGG